MGTRSITVMNDNDGSEIAVLYRQFDGYMDGHGQELAEFLKGHRIVNGIGQGSNAGNAFNGGACMAARIVAHFKGGEIGSFYLYPAGTRDAGEEFIYVVQPSETGINIAVTDVYDGKTIFNGTPEALLLKIAPKSTPKKRRKATKGTASEQPTSS